jgi:hypothetical protein
MVGYEKVWIKYSNSDMNYIYFKCLILSVVRMDITTFIPTKRHASRNVFFSCRIAHFGRVHTVWPVQSRITLTCNEKFRI